MQKNKNNTKVLINKSTENFRSRNSMSAPSIIGLTSKTYLNKSESRNKHQEIVIPTLSFNIYFSKPMDTESVLRSMHFNPLVNNIASFDWSENNTILKVNCKVDEIDTYFFVTIFSSATDTECICLESGDYFFTVKSFSGACKNLKTLKLIEE